METFITIETYKEETMLLYFRGRTQHGNG